LDQMKFEHVSFEFNRFKCLALWPGPHVSVAASPVSNPLPSAARPGTAVTGSYRRPGPPPPLCAPLPEPLLFHVSHHAPALSEAPLRLYHPRALLPVHARCQRTPRPHRNCEETSPPIPSSMSTVVGRFSRRFFLS
jgi:hypothetical protein